MYKVIFAVESTHKYGWGFLRDAPFYTTLSTVTEGVFLYSIAGKEYRLSSGSLILVPGGLSKRGRVPLLMKSAGLDHVVLCSIHFTGRLPAELDSGTPTFLKDHLFPELIHNFRAICRLKLLDKEYSTMELTGNLMVILGQLVQYAHEKAVLISEPRVRKVIHYITAHPEKKIRVGALARDLGISAAYLGSLFRQETGKSIRNYANEIKIRKVIQLFSYPEMSISEIANQCGFDDLFYFSKVFKDIMGRSPRKYRKEIF